MLCCLLILTLGITVQATEVKEYGKGLIFDDDDFLESLPEIIDVRLNEQAVENIRKFGNNKAGQKLDEIETVEMGSETITEQEVIPYNNEKAIKTGIEDYVVNQTISYDGSKSDHFPPIGNQGESNSCASWAYGYYQLTNNIANVRGLDAKHNVKYRISPAWIHNLIKEGGNINSGASAHEFFELVLAQGAPYWSDFSGETTITNYQSWNPDIGVWEKALRNRVDECVLKSLYNETEQKLDLFELKKELLNGYVFSFGTDFDQNLIQSNRIKYPENYKDEYILTGNFKTNKSGGHAMTIVGWDDSIKIDIDGDGTIDSEGALKIANSWGVNGTKTKDGFFWIAYDALLPQSTVQSMNINREEAIWGNVVFLLKPKVEYQPLLLLELTLKTESRRQLGIKIGASGTNVTTPKDFKYIFDKYFGDGEEEKAIFIFKNYSQTNENCDFYGNNTNKKEAAFIFDLTDTIVDYYGISNNYLDNRSTSFYIQIEDKKKDGLGSSLKDVKIIDRVNGTKKTLSNMSLLVDGSKAEVKLNATVVPGVVNKNKNFTLNFNYPIQKSFIDSDIKVKSNGKTVEKIDIISNGERKKISITPPSDGYAEGQYYSIDLSNIKSDGGNPLTGKTKIDFYVP